MAMRSERPGLLQRIAPPAVVGALILALWYLAAIFLNAAWARDQAERESRTLSTSALIADTWSQERPKLPAPHQIVSELWKTTVELKVTSKRSLVNHAVITLAPTLLGFALGSLFGALLAVGLTHSRTLEAGAMPWIVASQTIPLLAIAPMIIVALNAVGAPQLLAKSTISAYLSFFPVAVGVAAGLKSPDRMLTDQMRSWSATAAQTFWRLRLPSATPFLFASLKVAIAASLVGAIVGELPTGATAGLGARLLAGSYYGQTIQIWAALVMAALLAALLVGLISLLERIISRRMGFIR